MPIVWIYSLAPHVLMANLKNDLDNYRVTNKDKYPVTPLSVNPKYSSAPYCMSAGKKLTNLTLPDRFIIYYSYFLNYLQEIRWK